MFNAGSQRDVRKAKQKERRKRESELNDLRSVMDTRQGRRFIWRYLSDAGVFRQSFVFGQADATSFNEGRRSLGLALLADIHELDPAVYLTMATEARNEERREQKEAEAQQRQPVTEETEDA